jgi:putative phosphoribosyl transferase
MIFHDRSDAGLRLAQHLKSLGGWNDVVVLGIPRGGVTVAFEIARELHAPLDIFLSRKLGVPGHEELAFGAIAAGDGRYLDQQVIRAAYITPEQIERVTEQVRKTLAQRAALYRDNRLPLPIRGRTVILVDDGIATGASVYAAINALQQMKPAKLVLAVPVAPATTCAWLRTQVDELVCLYESNDFYAVGQFYENFSQVEDEEVINLLRSAARWSAASKGTVSEGGEEIAPENILLSVPTHAAGLVMFAHGSGSSRHSPRNRYVARMLQARGMATLLFDLLTPEEDAIDQRSAEFRFNIDLLTQRLLRVVLWTQQNAATRGLAIGLFGASTGAAAALTAAAQLPDLVTAVVSRGGRPDLAEGQLGQVRAAVLLLVGGKDEMVIGLNRKALEKLCCEHKQLMIIPGATHLFEEPGALEEVAHAASAWFVRYLASAPLKAAV